MVCALIWSIIPSLELGDYLSVQAHESRSVSHLIHLYLLYLKKFLLCQTINIFILAVFEENVEVLS